MFGFRGVVSKVVVSWVSLVSVGIPVVSRLDMMEIGMASCGVSVSCLAVCSMKRVLERPLP